MQEYETEQKKSFWMVYAAVAVFYVVMAIVYGIVVHKAAEDGANNVRPAEDESNDAATKMMPAYTDTNVEYIESEILQLVENWMLKSLCNP